MAAEKDWWPRLVALVESGDVVEAAKLARACSAPPQRTWYLVASQVAQRRFDRAGRLVEELGLDSPPMSPYLTDFVNALVERAQFALALKWLPLTPIPAVDIVRAMIKAGYIDTALRSISKLKLDPALFDVPNLIRALLDQGGPVSSAQSFVSAYGLEAQFPPEALVERMLAAAQWDAALAYVAINPRLKAAFPVDLVVRRAVAARDWVAALKYLTSHCGLPLSVSSKSDLSTSQLSLVRDLAEGLIRDRKLYFASRLVLTYKLEEEFPPSQLVSTMLREEQNHHALRFIRVWKLQNEFADQVATLERSRVRLLVDFRRLVDSLRGTGEKRRGVAGDVPIVGVAITRTVLTTRVIGAPPTSGDALNARTVGRAGDRDDADEDEILLPVAPVTQQRAWSSMQPATALPTPGLVASAPVTAWPPSSLSFSTLPSQFATTGYPFAVQPLPFATPSPPPAVLMAMPPSSPAFGRPLPPQQPPPVVPHVPTTTPSRKLMAPSSVLFKRGTTP